MFKRRPPLPLPEPHDPPILFTPTAPFETPATIQRIIWRHVPEVLPYEVWVYRPGRLSLLPEEKFATEAEALAFAKQYAADNPTHRVTATITEEIKEEPSA